VACYKLNFESLHGSKSFIYIYIYIYIYNMDIFSKSSLRYFRGSMVCGGPTCVLGLFILVFIKYFCIYLLL